MAVLPYEVYKILEEKVGKKEAEEIGKILEEALTAIEKKALEQKPILKAEIKDELTKELATKADIAETKAEIEKVRAEVENVRAEIKVLEAKFRFWFIILTLLVVFFNRDALGLIVELVKLLK